MHNMLIKLGTRGSKLALWQTHYVADLLQKEGLDTEIVTIETKGDKILNKSLSKIGSKGLFTAELEEQLHDGRIDIAVHSAKDLPSSLEDGLEIIAFSVREKAHDVVLSYHKATRLEDLSPDLIVGTSSTRRVALLKHFYPQIQVKDVRGNLQTRMRKLEEGHYHALILAYAGVARMEYDSFIVEELSPQRFTPPVGQGSIAIESSKNLRNDKKAFIQKACNHPETAHCLRAERAFLKTLQGGCSVPIFGMAQWEEDHIQMIGGIISLDGQQLLKEEIRGDKTQPEELGQTLADRLLSQGGDKILSEIKKQIG